MSERIVINASREGEVGGGGGGREASGSIKNKQKRVKMNPDKLD